MQTKRAGRQTVQLSHPPSVVSFANIGGRMEGQGPLSDYFDELSPDAFFGKKTWEQGEWKRVASPPVNWTTCWLGTC